MLFSLVVAVPATAGASSHLSTGCQYVNRAVWDDYYGIGSTGFSQYFEEGEYLSIQATSPGTASEISLLMVDGSQVDVLDTAGFPGELTWTVPEDGYYNIVWRTDIGNVTWAVECLETAPVADSDGDGVVDSDDLCPDTTLGDPPTRRSLKNRFYADAGGEFIDGVGDSSGYTVVDTYGCDDDQIIDMTGVGRGHEWFGITRSVLMEFIASYGS